MENTNQQSPELQQPIVPPAKSKIPSTLLMGTGAVVLLGLGLLVGYLLWGNNRIASQSVNQQVQVSPTGTSEPSSTQVIASPSPIVKNEHLFNISQELAIQLPIRATINGKTVTIDNTIYEIDTSGSVAGLCPMNDYGSKCGYTDETLPNIGTFRVWEDNTGIFALNPQEIGVDKYNINNFKIDKTRPNKVFTANEVDLWRTILKDIIVVK